MKTLPLSDGFNVVSRLLPGLFPTFRLQYRSREEIERYQFDRLKKIVEHAYVNVPLYREKYDHAGIKPSDIKTIQDFKRLPLTTKDELIDNFPEGVLAKGVDADKCIVSASSGSSGKVLKVIYDKSTLVHYMLAGLRTYSMGVRWRPWHKQVSIYSSKHPLDRILGLYWVRFIWTLDDVPSITRELVRQNPDILSCYPSVLSELMVYMMHNGVSPPKRLKAIFVNSEMSLPSERSRLADFFNCTILDEYSSEELNRIAAQCRAYNYHVFEDINYVEILDENGQDLPEGVVGEVVGTHLLNYAMPFIRYRQKDLASIVTKECSCGRKFKVLEKLQGRKNDYFTLPSGRILSSGFLLDLAYHLILDYPDCICDFCMIQDSRDHLTLEILPGIKFSTVMVREIEDKIRSAINEEVDVDVVVKDRLSKTRSGSRNPIISLVK
ncbi:MAG: hypothetical protein ABIH11_00800 [Candidatus Altiarchaeota archaeon]